MKSTMEPHPLRPDCGASVIARILKARGVDRVFGTFGGHVTPMWMCLDAEGISTVNARSERTAVYMAHAYGKLTGRPGVALVSAGPGVTDAVPGIANAHVARAPVIVLAGVPPHPQSKGDARQGIKQAEMLLGITRLARTVEETTQVPQALDEALAMAYGEAGEVPGPVLLDLSAHTLSADVPRYVQFDQYLRPYVRPEIQADPDAVTRALDLISLVKQPLVIGGRGAREARSELIHFLDAISAAFFSTGECKGLLPNDHPSLVTAMRRTAMADSDLVITVGCSLDSELGFGSPEVFSKARWIRIADNAAEFSDNRRGEVELFATPRLALQALVAAGRGRAAAVDRAWRDRLHSAGTERLGRLLASLASTPTASGGYLHPNHLLSELWKAVGSDGVLVADHRDFLSFARIAMRCSAYLEPGAPDCIGIGSAFGIGAALASPGRPVTVLTEAGAADFNAIEIGTAVRLGLPLLVVVANVVGSHSYRSDLAALARAFGACGVRIETVSDLRSALDRALGEIQSGRPALLDVLVSGDPISSDGLD